MTIEELREQIEARLREAREEVARLKAALDALGHGGGNAAPVVVAKAHPQPRARATPKRRRAPRGATRHAVLEALAEGNAMTAGQLATATGLPRERVATELSKLVKTGDLVKPTAATKHRRARPRRRPARRRRPRRPTATARTGPRPCARSAASSTPGSAPAPAPNHTGRPLPYTPYCKVCKEWWI